MHRSIAILGSTGSVGTQTLDVVALHPEQFRVEALAAGYNLPLLIEQIHQFMPRKVSVATKELADRLKQQAPSHVEIFYGEQGLLEVAANTDTDFVVSALVGSQGLRPTLAAIEAGKTIGLANKESLVTAGHIVMEAVRSRGVDLLPLDSEHSAIFQCLNGERSLDIESITLTASGGSFRDLSRNELHGVTVEQALRHPNWSMGSKLTIDSATMVNKGLEVIEAHWLFDLPFDRIEVLLHPESIIHSYVEFVDHSIIAQLGTPDMRVPIQYALTYPNRLPTRTKPLKLSEIGKLHFQPMDMERFPCLKMAYDCGRAGGTMPSVFNAANEIAVDRFLKGELAFLDIEEVIFRTIELHSPSSNPGLEEILSVDAWARQTASGLLKN